MSRRLVLLLSSGWSGRFCTACPWAKLESSATRLWQTGTSRVTDPFTELFFYVYYSDNYDLNSLQKTGCFYVALTVHSCIIFFKWSQLGAHYFLVYLFQLLYMFRATICPSSRELTVSMRHWNFQSVCVAVWSEDRAAPHTECRPNCHT